MTNQSSVWQRSPLRWLSLLFAGLSALLFLRPGCSQEGPAPSGPQFKTVSASFNPWHAMWLSGSWGGPAGRGKVGPEWQECLRRYKALGITTVRLSIQWRDVQKNSTDEPNWQVVDDAIRICKEEGLKVWVCAGVKTPRYPEVYLPDDLKAKAQLPAPGIGSEELNTTLETGIGKELLEWVEKVVRRYQGMDHVVGIQVENEALEPFGSPKRSIPLDFLRKEVELADRLTFKPLQLTYGAGLTGDLFTEKGAIKRRKIREDLCTLPAERIGLNLYNQVAAPFIGSISPAQSHWDEVKRQVDAAKKGGKIVFAAEAQCEPWWQSDKDRNFKDPNGNPLKPRDLHTVMQRIKALGIDEANLWGIEWIIACEEQGNTEWAKELKRALGIR